MKVLIAEDDAALLVFLKRGLELEGYSVESVSDGEGAVAQALDDPPNLLILDLNLPGKDGVQVLSALQQVKPAIPTLVLTGRTSVEDRVACLDLGADDYLQKPFSLHEFLARCRAIRRRREKPSTAVVLHDDLQLDRISRVVQRAGIDIDLTAKEYTLLEYFLQHRGRVINRIELIVEVFQLSPETQTNVVDVYISYLRTKLNVQPESSSLIETVRGQGYTIRPLSSSGRKRPVGSALLPEELSDRASNE